jgi:serine protease Do
MKRAGTVLAMAVCGVLITGPLFGAEQNTGKKRTQSAQPPATNAPKVAVDAAPIPRESQPGTSFSGVVKKVSPAVVNIYTTTVVRDRPMPFSDPFLRRFFGGPFDEPPQPRREQSLGSGVIVSADGYILTANHVVEGADEVRVVVGPNEQEFKAKVVGNDPPTDIAVMRLEGDKPFPVITLGDSDKLEVGDTVLAVGNPFGVGQTVTSGIISGLSRGGFGITGYEDFIQTDAAINPGNSGGALVDSLGVWWGLIRPF